MKIDFKSAGALFSTFFKIGLFTFGGGYAMIPIIESEVVTKKEWLTNDDLLEIIAVAESTPGPIAINTATFVGYRKAGILGAFCATMGVVVPAFTVIFILSFFIEKFKHLKAVEYAFNGIRAGVLALIIKALISMAKKCPKNIFSYIIILLSFLLTAIFDVNVFFIVIGCALAGLTYYMLVAKRGKKQ